MFKSLAAKAIVPVVITVTGFVLVCSIILYVFIKEDMTRSMIRHSVDLADTVVKSAHYAMQHDDRESLRNIIKNVGEQEGVEHLRIFDKKGLIRFSSHPEETDRFVDKTASGCLECHADAVPKATLEEMQQARYFTNGQGANVVAITAPIYNEPSCYTAACHVHDAEQQMLGLLDIGLYMSPLEQTLGALRERIAIFTLMVLVLTAGGVIALLRRNILLPIQALAEFTDTAQDANMEQIFPEKSGEIGRIAGNVIRLRQALRACWRQPESSPSKDSGKHS